MAQNWNKYVNSNFYGLDGSYLDNTEIVEFKSGRVIKYLKNSTPKKQFALNLSLDDKTLILDSETSLSKTEFEWFLYWYENTVKSGTLSFYLDDIVTNQGVKEYLLSDVPTWIGQRQKEVTITIEEV